MPVQTSVGDGSIYSYRPEYVPNNREIGQFEGRADTSSMRSIDDILEESRKQTLNQAIQLNKLIRENEKEREIQNLRWKVHEEKTRKAREDYLEAPSGSDEESEALDLLHGLNPVLSKFSWQSFKMDEIRERREKQSEGLANLTIPTPEEETQPEWMKDLLVFPKSDPQKKRFSEDPFSFFSLGTDEDSSPPLTPQEAKEAFAKAPDGQKDDRFAEWLNVCSKTYEAKEAFKYTSNDDRRDLAFKRWLELCVYMSDAIEAYKKTSQEHRENWAFERLLELCKYPSDAEKAYKLTSNEYRENLAFKRWLELCSTVGEAKRAYRKTSNSQREEWAKERIRELGGKI
jgi:hypothetical protein